MKKDHMRIGKYQLLELLGVGRYTDVWLAERIDLKKKVAIKILFPQEVRAGNARLRAKKLFFNEAQTLAQLAHPHIVQAFDYEEEEEHGWSYFVMEYTPYGSLADRHGPGELLPLSTVKAYTSQMGRAIQYMHSLGLIHRDIKPQNMFLKTRGLVLLGDFGLVMRNHGRFYPWMKMEFGGTRVYMAPEQEGGEPCPASDQYAYATIVFEWLTGYWPFYGNDRELAWKRRHLLPPSMRALVPEIPVAVEWVDETSASHSSRMPAIYRHAAASRHAVILRQQGSAGLVPQPEFAEQGDVLVAPHPVVPRFWQAEEDFWDPMFTSNGDDMQMILPSRLQNLRSRVHSAWERIGGFLRGSL